MDKQSVANAHKIAHWMRALKRMPTPADKNAAYIQRQIDNAGSVDTGAADEVHQLRPGWQRAPRQ